MKKGLRTIPPTKAIKVYKIYSYRFSMSIFSDTSPFNNALELFKSKILF